MMAGQWKEVVRLRFKGDRFRDHALDLTALGELSQFQRIVAETAKALWRAANPSRERLPSHFEDRARLCLRRIEEGSAVAPLEVFLEEPEQPQLWEAEPAQEVAEAVALAQEVFEAVEEDVPLPERLPKHLVPEFAKWGQSLAESEEVELLAPGRRPARVTPKYRERLAAFAETPYEDLAEVSGEVLEADVRQRRFQLWLDDETSAFVSFTEDQEDLVTTALKDHRSLRVRVRGRGEFSPDGKLQRFRGVDRLTIIETGAREYDPNAPAIEEVLARIAAQVPQEDWDRLPADLAENLDHYIYGSPKQ